MKHGHLAMLKLDGSEIRSSESKMVEIDTVYYKMECTDLLYFLRERLTSASK